MKKSLLAILVVALFIGPLASPVGAQSNDETVDDLLEVIDLEANGTEGGVIVVNGFDTSALQELKCQPEIFVKVLHASLGQQINFIVGDGVEIDFEIPEARTYHLVGPELLNLGEESSVNITFGVTGEAHFARLLVSARCWPQEEEISVDIGEAAVLERPQAETAPSIGAVIAREDLQVLESALRRMWQWKLWFHRNFSLFF